MDRFVIQGGSPLHGTLAVSGSKNSALPALAACLLTAEPVRLHRVPRVRDLRTMEKLLAYTGAQISQEGTDITCVHAARIEDPSAPYDIVKTMRASSLVLGPLVARTGRARVSLPGGCAIGARPIDLHMAALEHLGAELRQTQGYVEASAPKGLRGNTITFERITVTGTEDVMMAAVLARGETVLHNAAREPEVVDLADLLTRMGARIEGAGTPTIRIQGVSELGGTEHTIIPDRIEAGTFLLAAALAGGDVTVTGCHASHLTALLDSLARANIAVSEPAPGHLRVRRSGPIKPISMVTEEHPGFATDLQAQFMALMTQAEGTCTIEERIFENRFMHVLELARMGADIKIDGRRATITGPAPLTGAQVIASDLRASASLVLAALAAHGETVIDRVYHIDRGYENFETKLNGVGARIERRDDGTPA